ncbi:MAG: hypothetical protein IPM56_17895 [Ignavibacteriales bacterium]|nr:MAG: hypothetical protein IPM56_17895 [Ignavibacteriales bacterium]
MKTFLIVLFAFISIFASDSTATVWIEGAPVKINISSDFYINLQDFQNFIDKQLQDFRFTEIIIEDVTGDALSDSLTNFIYLTSNGCVVESKIFSKGIMVHHDSCFVLNERGNDENSWGSDSNYLKLFPYSLLYIGYKIRMESYLWEKSRIEESIFMPLNFRRIELENEGLKEIEIVAELIRYKEYILNYKGKFINTLSMSNPDTYFYDSTLNKFVLFYAP